MTYTFPSFAGFLQADGKSERSEGKQVIGARDIWKFEAEIGPRNLIR
jgi:hypothetical protein